MSRPGVLRTRTESRLRLAAERALKAGRAINDLLGASRSRAVMARGMEAVKEPVTIELSTDVFSEARGALHDLAAALEGK